MRIDVLTLFPDVFDNLNSFSIIKKAIDSKKVEVNTHNLRDYAYNSRKVDDYPYGGCEAKAGRRRSGASFTRRPS